MVNGYSVQLLADHRANRDYILDAIEQAGRALDPEQGTLVLFFSGHMVLATRRRVVFL